MKEFMGNAFGEKELAEYMGVSGGDGLSPLGERRNPCPEDRASMEIPEG